MIELLGFCILFASGSALVNLGFTAINYIFVALVTITALLYSGKVVFRFRFMMMAILFLVLFSAMAIGRGDTPWSEMVGGINAKVLLCMFSSLFLLQFSMQEVVTRMNKLFEWLLIFSLFTFVVLNLAPGLTKPIGYLRLGEAVNSLFYVAYYRPLDLFKFGFVRNQGIFWEPGVYAFFITFFFLLKVHFLQSTKRLWLYPLCMLSSFSVGGIAIFSVAFTHYFYTVTLRNKMNSESKTIMDLVTIIIMGFAAVLVLWGISNTDSFLRAISYIFQRDFVNDNSATGRIRDLIYGVAAASEKPIFGHGNNFNDYYDLTRFLFRSSKESYGGGVTNSIVALYYNFGFIFLCFYLWLMRCFSKVFAPSHSWAVFGILILLLMHEPLHVSMFTLFLLIYGGAVYLAPLKRQPLSPPPPKTIHSTSNPV